MLANAATATTIFDSWLMWAIFGVVVVGLIALDLGVLNRKSHKVSIKEALTWTLVWFLLAVGFGGLIWFGRGADPAFEYLGVYLIEQSLSIDNVFVFLMVFTFFKIPDDYKHRVLFWGVLGAIVFRFIFIFAGGAALQNFNFLFYPLGAILIFSAWRVAFQGEQDVDLGKSRIVRVIGKLFKLTPEFHGSKFFVVLNGVRYATPLFMALAVIEIMDLVFALDSIPAALAISTDTMIVYTAMIFAILGLRSLTFAVAGIMDAFHFLKFGLGIVLAFIGVKMILGVAIGLHIPVWLTLLVIAASLGGAMIASVIHRNLAHNKNPALDTVPTDETGKPIEQPPHNPFS